MHGWLKFGVPPIATDVSGILGVEIEARLKKRGDKAVVHGLRGKPSNLRMEESIEKEAEIELR